VIDVYNITLRNTTITPAINATAMNNAPLPRKLNARELVLLSFAANNLNNEVRGSITLLTMYPTENSTLAAKMLVARLLVCMSNRFRPMYFKS
jgi:hypothetical protein